MNHKYKRLLVLLLIAAMALTLPVFSASAAEPLDLTKPVKVTFTGGPSDYVEDINSAGITIDLYKIATAVKETDVGQDSHGDMYVFSVDSAYSSLGIPTSYAEMNTADWSSLAQSTAKAVLLRGGKPIETAPLGAITDTSALTAGLYLVVPHGTKLTTPDKYVVMDGNSLTTIVNSDVYVYSYYPELLAVPSTLSSMGIDKGTSVDRDAFEDPAGNQHEGASTAGEWQYSISALLKPTREYRFGDLVINKTLESWESSGPATFVFSVVAESNDKEVYNNVVSLTFNSAGSKSYTITGEIPVGAQVTVEEIYSGAGYELTSRKIQDTTINPPGKDAASVSFSNKFTDNSLVTGYGVENTFKLKEDGKTWEYIGNSLG